jgi:hypothetical protein
MEAYMKTIPEREVNAREWTLPVLRGSGGHLTDPVSTHSESDAIETRYLGNR